MVKNLTRFSHFSSSNVSISKVGPITTHGPHQFLCKSNTALGRNGDKARKINVRR